LSVEKKGGGGFLIKLLKTETLYISQRVGRIIEIDKWK